MARLLIIDDDPRFLDILSKLLVGRQFEVFTVDNGESAIEWLATNTVDLLVCDIHMKPLSGMEVLKTVHEKYPSVGVIMMTAFGTVDTAMECLRMGAFDYLTKPFRVQEFVEVIERALEWDTRQSPGDEVPAIEYRLADIIAGSKSMQDACTMIERVAPTDATVLFHGERGVGKEHAGRTIHALSPRRDGPFVVVDCANATGGNFAYHLFGEHIIDVPNPAPQRLGMFRQAQGGTIWLSEIGALSLGIQQQLLRVLKEQVIIPEGGTEPVQVNVRVLAETSKDLHAAVAQGTFRADLYARFAPIAVEIKPLRERREDIIPLLWHCLRRRLGHDVALPQIGPDARGLLLHYLWPGNVSELDSVADLIFKNGVPSRIGSQQLPGSIIRSLSGLPSTALTMEGSGRAHSLKAFLSRETKLAAARRQAKIAPPAPAPTRR